MFKSVVRAYFINLFALWTTANYIGAFHLNNGLQSIVLVGLGFTLLHLIVIPLIRTILGPINFLTMGFLGLVIDSAALYLLTIYFPQVSITPWSFTGANLSGLILPAFQFNLITGTVLSAFIINIIRQLLTVLTD